MYKIATIFDRDWDGHRGVVPKLLHNPGGAVATEKLDGTNVRVTVRAGEAVRLEARRNPTKPEKARGIEEPWYRQAWPAPNGSHGYEPEDFMPGDRRIVEAMYNTPLEGVSDGEWSAEAVGPKIQGNPLKLAEHRLFFFDLDRLPAEVCVPVLGEGLPVPPSSEEQWTAYFHELLGYLAVARSRVNPEVGIEGIVWHGDAGFGGKLKLRDFK